MSIESFEEFGLSPRSTALCSPWGTKPHPGAGRGHPGGARGPRSVGLFADRHRQDRRLRPAHPTDAVPERGRPRRGSARCLVLTPTRELALQIADSFKGYGRNLRLSLAAVYGGVGQMPQVRACARGIDVLVATPAACWT